MNLASKFARLQRAVGGNCEKMDFEWTCGIPVAELSRITLSSRAAVRIFGELHFALELSESRNHEFDELIENVVDFLWEKTRDTHSVTMEQAYAAEKMLMPLQTAAREYKVLLVAHAHIDMDWEWTYQETVATTLATFRTMLHIMDEYPEFTFSQSQASVYEIVEEYDPDLMEQIKKRIAEGRWEVNATGWVEPDKNMPNTESLLRHIQSSREYLSSHWGVKNFEVDFVPDSFGHNINTPEIDQFGDVKYLYHCRGLDGDYVLYRYRAPSGKEILAYREPYWYNTSMQPYIGAGILDLSRRCAGLKTGMAVYGVGDHGGGPTRRDVERAIDMMSWPIFPKLEFGTVHQFFHEAESVREKLPVVDFEMNYVANGCYTTQSRIKRGNRRLEAALCDAEAVSVEANKLVNFRFADQSFNKAWRNVLFNQFHDILTGSCVQDSREHAMGLYQTSMATANTQHQNAIRVISENIDTSSIPVNIDPYNSCSEGAGAGFGVENFVGVPSPERGTGLTRIFHLFNPLTMERREVMELTVWDWMGDLHNVAVHDSEGNAVEFQMLDRELVKYWDHYYFRILVDVCVPALGYNTVILTEEEPEKFPFYDFYNGERTKAPIEDAVLDNGTICVKISSADGRIYSLLDKKTGTEMIRPGQSAGLTLIETDTNSSSAWNIGRHMHEQPVDRCIHIENMEKGTLRSSVKAEYTLLNSKITVLYQLDKYQRGVTVHMEIDWREIGSEIIPVLDYRVPAAYVSDLYMYDIPAGKILRSDYSDDVPGLQYGALIQKEGASLILANDSKYGYRGLQNTLSVTLINTAADPDPYPERGIQKINLMVGAFDGDSKEAEETATRFTHKMSYQAGNAHKGSLPMKSEFLSCEAKSSVVSAVTAGKEGTVLVRLYETAGRQDWVKLHFKRNVKKAESVNLWEHPNQKAVEVKGGEVSFVIEPYCLFEVKAEL